MTAGLCGSAPYIAPEEYVAQEFDPRAVDVWATGVIYMAMRTGRHLWTTARDDPEAGDDFYHRYLLGRRDEAGYAPIESLHRVRRLIRVLLLPLFFYFYFYSFWSVVPSTDRSDVPWAPFPLP